MDSGPSRRASRQDRLWWHDDVMDPGIRLKSRKGRWVLLATVLGSGIAFLDATVVNVALPTIGKELHATVAQLQWIVNAYTLTLAGLILLGGSLGDRYGRRRVFVLGAIWFAVASALCAAANQIAPSTNTRRLPYRSPSEPPSRISPASVSV